MVDSYAAVLLDAEVPSVGAEVVIDPWLLVRHGTDPAGFAQDESLFALANGTLGVRGNLEESDSASQATLLSAVWERSPIDYHERFPGFAAHTDTRIPVADAARIHLRLGDTPVRLDQGTWLHFERVLDLRQGCYRRRLRWRSPEGATLEIEAERIVSLEDAGLLAIHYRVRSLDYAGPITLESSISTAREAAEQGFDPRIGSRINGGLGTCDAHAGEDLAWVGQQTTHSGIRLVCAQRQRHAGELRFRHANLAPHGVTQVYEGVLAPGQAVSLEKYVAYAFSSPLGGDQATDLLARARASLDTADALGYPALLARQARALSTLWAQADLAIDGDPTTEQALRFNLFHLFQSSSRDSHGTTAAKGLTGEGYEGHYFWDAEVFMLPVLATLAPELARAMLLYRYRTLDHARRHARELDHPHGALYAWRTISGDECSSYFPSGSAQYHINAAVAWAIRLYVDASGDDAFLLAHGAEMLFETARIWLQIGHFSARHGGAFCIHEVTGPDEYSALVDNNHYTNRMAQRHLQDAADVADWMALSHPAEHAALGARINLQADEASQWRRAARAMHLPVDAALGIFPQDDGFLDKPRLPPQLAATPGRQPLLLLLHPLTLYRHQVCKQADTLLALMLAGEQVEVAAKRRNFDYYEGVTVHDSTLSASTFAVLAAEVGYADKAHGYFLDTLRVDLDDLHGNAAHGLHMAAMAGSWLALSWGYGGLRVHDGLPALAPRLPAAWKSYRFGLRWRGAHLRVEVDGDGARYTLTEGSSLTFLHDGLPQRLHAGQPLHLPCAGSVAPPPLKAVVFDLDGVLADTAVLHRAAWQQLANEIGAPLDEITAGRMKGVDRRGSLDILLEHAPRSYSETEKEALAARKNAHYIELIGRLGPQDLLPGARAAVESVRRAGLKTALASASRNAPQLLERLGIATLFDCVVDAGRIARSKPDPEIFLAAARGLGLAPGECLGVEDAAAGIAALHAAGMAAVGIGRAQELDQADVLLPDIAAFDISRFIA
ncbi:MULTISPECIES: beta-phosphoglucomutase [Rhodanobacter]|uniref:beta-phosphoglucomutase n=1 Tax=Rhodanobacter TaxID=75309 RepID=UPI000402FC42|nr:MULTISPECIES: beta-phosphoglucomutase [Rhodanobacter]TAN17283.1 MAG: beta-phosphoglucomutase [Rhodanobacter sp.]UJJ55749.1 beta-phosphoglucomutase [Rhodanobacter thiooxydans]